MPRDLQVFANSKTQYPQDGENPFKMGSARKVKTISRKTRKPCRMDTRYLPKRARRAFMSPYRNREKQYGRCDIPVYHAGGRPDFLNQQMGGGNGFSGFTLHSTKARIIKLPCAIAANMPTYRYRRCREIGGGMGKHCRLPHPEGMKKIMSKVSRISLLKEITPTQNSIHTPKSADIPTEPKVHVIGCNGQGYRTVFTTERKQRNDYTDDYQCRGHWVNYHAGGSSVLPKADGSAYSYRLGFCIPQRLRERFGAIPSWETLGISMTH